MGQLETGNGPVTDHRTETKVVIIAEWRAPEPVSDGQSTGEEEEAARTHMLHPTVLGADGPVGVAIPLYDHALN